MTIEEVMDALHQDDVAMQIVQDQLAGLREPAPTKEDQTKLPSYKHWQLSTYWSRGAVGVIRRMAAGRNRYVGTFGSGGSEGMAVALASMDHFAAGPYIYIHMHMFFGSGKVWYIYIYIANIYYVDLYVYVYMYMCF